MRTALLAPEMLESLEALRGNVRMEAKFPQLEDDFLSRQSTKVQTRTEEVEAHFHTVLHKLKHPLSAILTTSNAIFNITDLTPEELYEYLQQIRSNAYKMDEIINNPLPHSEVCKADVP